jgi:hypothetical protein
MAISSVEAIDPKTPNSSVPRSKGSTIIWVSMSNCCKQLAIVASKLCGHILLQFPLPLQVPHNFESIANSLKMGPTLGLTYCVHFEIVMKMQKPKMVSTQ